MEIRSERVELTVAGAPGKMPAYVAAPASGGPHPAVLVIEEIFGVNAHIRDVTERVAREGYVAIAPDIHHRHAAGLELAYDAAGMQRGMQLIPKLTVDGISADVDAALAYLGGRGDVRADRVGCVGFCIGGHVAYLAACLKPLRATAAFYGGGIATFGPGGTQPTVQRSGDIKGRILCLFGGKDTMIPAEQVGAISRALEEGKVRHEVVVYPHSGHAFFCDVAARGSYVAEDAADAWERVKTLFAEELRA